MVIANIISFILVIIGGLNWGLVGFFNWNLVSAIFGATPNFGNVFVYCLIFLAAVWLIISAIITMGKITLCTHRKDNM